MHWKESPIRITNKLNLPTFTTPSPAKPAPRTTHSTQSKLHLEQARKEVLYLRDLKDFSSALNKVNQLLNQHPSDIRSYQIKGELVFGLKMYSQALETYDQLLAITSIMQNVEVTTSPVKMDNQNTISQIKKMRALYYYNKGLCLQKLNRHAQAVETLRKSIQINKNKADSYICMAESYRSLKQPQKLYPIYSKLIENNPHKSEYLFKIIRLSSSQKDYATALGFIDKGVAIWTSQQTKWCNQQQVLVELLTFKGNVLKTLQKHEEAIHAYLQVLAYKPAQPKLVKILSQMALCYDFMGNLQKAAQYYQKILTIDDAQIEIRNNLANLYLRQAKYQEAVQLLAKAIENKKYRPSDKDFLSSILLRCHRVIANSRLHRVDQARSDLEAIMVAVDGGKLIEIQSTSQWDNYSFIRYIVDRYKPILLKMETIRLSNQNSQELKTIQQQLISSISQQLQTESVPVNLQKLQQRIDRLYNDILSFKKKTLEQHQENQHQVHHRIVQIQEMLVKREEDTLRIEKELEEMKGEHGQVYQLVKQLTNKQGKKLQEIVEQLKKGGKQKEACYAQQMYWVFNAYFIAIRLAANHLISQPHNLHLNKVSSFFSKFKSIFQTLSHIPHLGTACQIITATISLYLSQQSKAVYRILDSIITNNYTLQKDLQEAVQEAVITLIDSSYISEALSQSKSNSILKETRAYDRAYQWFKQKKNKVVDKMFKIDSTLSNDERRVRELVVEDVSAIFVYLVKNKPRYVMVPETKPEILVEAVQKTLILGFKKKQISSLFSAQVGKEEKMVEKGQRCSQCLIYSASIPDEIYPIIIDSNIIMDELIKDAIEQNDMELFNYAVSRLAFRAK